MKAKNLFSLLAIILWLTGCVSGFRLLGEEQLKDGTWLQSFYGKTPGNSGPDVTFAEVYHCAPKCEKNSHYSGAAPGLAEVAAAGAVAAGLAAGGNIGAAALLRPTRINSSTNVTGVEGGIKNENEQKQQAEGGSGGKIEKGAVANNLTANPTAYGGEGGKGGAGGQGGVANAQGGKAIGGSIQPGAVQVTAQGGKAEIENSGNSKLENKTGPISVTASPTATASPSQSAGLSNYSPSGAYSGSSSYSNSEGGKVIGSGNSTNINKNVALGGEGGHAHADGGSAKIISPPPCSWCGHGHKD